MEKTIITIGYDLPGHSDRLFHYSSNQSLLDADIIIFESDFSSYDRDSYSGYYNGKPCYDQNDSFRLKEDTRRWKRELLTALEAGKTVFVFFTEYQESYVHSGRKEFSGTGRNTLTTNIIESFNNYEFFPIELPTVIPKSGKGIIFKDNPIFSAFWDGFKNDMAYKSYLDEEVANPLFMTKTGHKTVGAIFKVGNGSLVLLPPLEYDEKLFIRHDPKKDQDFWTPAAIRWGKRLLKALVDIDGALRKGGDRTPQPDWVSSSEYELAGESHIKSDIELKSKSIDNLVAQKTELLNALEKEGALKDLLFEKGKRLETAIIEALKVLGYDASNYDDGNLEFDQVILSPEGDRLIGEAEGKDSAAVNVDKFRQLSTNIQEDLQRDEVKQPAMGILFGNGYRLTNPSNRGEQFTEKCITSAKSSNCILVRTTDLFRVSKYIKESSDASFAQRCREEIKSSVGKIVSFPSVPASPNNQGQTEVKAES